MKCLSIKQPWAWLIMNRKKTIETRTWAAPENLIGEIIGIHASLKMDSLHYKILAMIFYCLPASVGLPKGRLLGTARLVRVIEYKSPEAFYADADKHLCYEGDFEAVRYGFELEVIEVYDNPPPLKGALKFFERWKRIGEVEYAK